jgi:hypothetical protein
MMLAVGLNVYLLACTLEAEAEVELKAEGFWRVTEVVG